MRSIKKNKQKTKAWNRKINEGGKVTQCKDFPWYWEPTSSVLGLLGGERTGLRQGGGERKPTREAERSRRGGVRDGGGRKCLGMGCREKAETEKGRGKKRCEQKLRQDSRLPGYPHLFIDLGMIECDWAAAWQQKPAWRQHVDELAVAETQGSRLLVSTVSGRKEVWTWSYFDYLSGFRKSFIFWYCF